MSKQKNEKYKGALKMKKEKILSKPLCMTLLICAFVYGLILPFCWGNNPLEPNGTLSLLCETRKAFFWFWALMTGLGSVLNVQYMYHKLGSKKKYLDVLNVLAFISIITIALTLGHSINDWNPKRLAHWIATGGYIVFLVASMLLYFLSNIKRQKLFAVLSACIAAILALFLVLFAVIGKSGVMEIVPNALLQIMLFVVNFTPAAKTKESTSAVTQKAKADAVQ